MKLARTKRLAAAAAGLGLLGLASLAGAAVQPEHGWGMPRDASVDGWRVDWLINSTTVFVLILFVIMCAWMVYACLKHGERHAAEYDHGTSSHSVSVALGISAVIFFVVDGNLFYNAVVDINKAFWNYSAAEGRTEVVRIEINARQWAWEARYAGPDGKFDTADDAVTLNDVRVPVKTPVLLQLASVDVIHSFYLPNFRVKSDAIPGNVTRLLFEAKETGEFDIGCAQHCGTGHYKMKGKLTVLDGEAYRAWASEAATSSQRAYDAKDEDAHWGWPWREI